MPAKSGSCMAASEGSRLVTVPSPRAARTAMNARTPGSAEAGSTVMRTRIAVSSSASTSSVGTDGTAGSAGSAAAGTRASAASIAREGAWVPARARSRATTGATEAPSSSPSSTAVSMLCSSASHPANRVSMRSASGVIRPRRTRSSRSSISWARSATAR